MPFNELLDILYSCGISPELIVIIVSAFPVIELRGAIPLALNVMDLSWYNALILSIIGNLIPVPFLLLFLGTITKQFSKIGIFERWFRWLSEHTVRKGRIIERYKRIGLVIFVAVPVPITGAWTGSLAATLFNIGFKQALLYIFIGICIAGGIVTGICLLSRNMF